MVFTVLLNPKIIWILDMIGEFLVAIGVVLGVYITYRIAKKIRAMRKKMSLRERIANTCKILLLSLPLLAFLLKLSQFFFKYDEELGILTITLVLALFVFLGMTNILRWEDIKIKARRLIRR